MLPPSEVDGFAHDGDALTPRYRGTPLSRVRLPQRASAGFHLEDARVSANPVTVDVELGGARDVAADAGDGYLVFRGALGDGADLVHRPSGNGVEDFVRFEARPEVEELRYTVSLGSAVAGLRLVSNTLELVDASSVPRLHVSPPYVIDATGTRRVASLSVEGCAVDEDPAPVWDRPVTAPGASQCTVRVHWSGDGLSYPLLVDPSWSNSGTLIDSREFYSAAPLSGNRVLVAGGLGSSGLLATAEIYDNSTATWSSAGSLSVARWVTAIATAAISTSTYVFVLGGADSSGPSNVVDRYDVAAGTWTTKMPMSAPRAELGASKFSTSTGDKILATGGITTGPSVLNTAEWYDPSANTWTATGNTMNTTRFLHSSTELVASPPLKVLIFGGKPATVPQGSGEFGNLFAWNETTQQGVFGSAGTPDLAGFSNVQLPVAVRLPGDKVLIAGGTNANTTGCNNIASRWNNSGTSWTHEPNMSVARCFAAGSMLLSGNALVTGGNSANTAATALASTEVFNSSTQTWGATFSMNNARFGHTATWFGSLSGNSLVLAVGGAGTAGGLISQTELSSSLP